MSIRSFAAIGALKLKLRDVVQITKAGSHWKARFHGHASFCFGSTKQEARQRLLDTTAGSYKNSNRNASMRAKKARLEGRAA